jgi:hypothetical protein
MLPFRMFVYTEPRSAIPTPWESTKLQPGLNSQSGSRRSSYSSSPPFNSCIFNSFRTLAAQWSAATPVFSDASGLFPLQWGCTPSPHLHRLPLLHSALFPAIHPISLQPLTKCSSSNPFVLITIHFHGGCTPLPNGMPSNS